MAKFYINGIEFISNAPKAVEGERIEHARIDGVDEYKISLKLNEDITPEAYTLSWERPQIDEIGFWSSKSSQHHNLNPEWWPRTADSRTASGMPLIAVYSKSQCNRACVALSDPSTATRISVGVVEERATLIYKVELFSQLTAKMSDYEVVLRIDNRQIPVTEAITSVREWWTSLGFAPAYVPFGATEPLYSAWYSFHQRTIPDEIVAECEQAVKYGMTTLIVDDGWQTDDNSRGYGYCGDWRISKSKIPDMQDFVDRIHALGMKFMVWFSVPYVGFESEAKERFKGKFLYSNNKMKAYALDPRFKDVRDFLTGIYVDYVKKYGWDGLKLDFIDAFHLSEESSTDYEKMDCVSLEEGVTRLIEQTCTELKAINPEFLIEFRQSYVGPAISKYGNMLRVGDCPNDAIINRIHSLDLRLTSAGIPVHSDMLMWHGEDTVESVAYQLYATMFCVPQISIRFDSISDEQKKLLKAHLSFWRAHKDTILNGKLDLTDIEANYSSAKSTKNGESVCVLYQQVPQITEKGIVAYIFNSTGKDNIYVELDSERAVEYYNIFGEKYSTQALPAGVHKLTVKNCESVKII